MRHHCASQAPFFAALLRWVPTSLPLFSPARYCVADPARGFAGAGLSALPTLSHIEAKALVCPFSAGLRLQRRWKVKKGRAGLRGQAAVGTGPAPMESSASLGSALFLADISLLAGAGTSAAGPSPAQAQQQQQRGLREAVQQHGAQGPRGPGPAAVLPLVRAPDGHLLAAGVPSPGAGVPSPVAGLAPSDDAGENRGLGQVLIEVVLPHQEPLGSWERVCQGGGSGATSSAVGGAVCEAQPRGSRGAQGSGQPYEAPAAGAEEGGEVAVSWEEAARTAHEVLRERQMDWFNTCVSTCA